ncbi:o-succinylbenzoate synthase [Arsenophonus endosymbiont of Bemisia tabaci Q2]|nr:o-succinylbenzoate synthase [Arsenophonus endosymbiont of Bemisia tabaci Q2]
MCANLILNLKNSQVLAPLLLNLPYWGSLNNHCKQLIDDARALGLNSVISSSLESSFGLTQLARIACWLTPETVPGLDTLSLFQTQLVRQWPESSLPLIGLNELELIWQNE